MTNATRKWQATATPAERPREVRDVAQAVYGVARLIVDELEEQRIGRMVCAACGCLCLPAETCPGCQARRVVEARAAAVAAWRRSA